MLLLERDGLDLRVSVKYLEKLWRCETVNFAIIILHQVEHTIAIVLRVAFNKEDCSSYFTNLELNKVEKHPGNHSVLVLTGTVVKDKVNLSGCSAIAKTLHLEKLPDGGCNCIASLLPFSCSQKKEEERKKRTALVNGGC
jgi:hypothetical protein